MNYQNIHVNGNRMEPNRIYAGTRGSYVTDVSFSFSGEWEGLTKKLIFYPVRGTPVYTVYTYGTVRIPPRVMRNAGISLMLISGYRVTEDGKIGEKIITASASVLVDPTESDIRNEPDIPEATVFEEIVAKLGAPYIGESGNWYIWDVDTHEFVDTGLPARGEKGETGRGLTILGKYGSLDELRASVEDAQPGDAYAVGEKAPYTIYIWDEVTGDFTDHGDMRGVGITKIEQITDNTGSGEPNTIRIYTDDGEEYDYTVYNGERGHPGNIWIGETEPPDDSYVIWLNPGGAVSGFVASYQGTANAGRVLAVGEDGGVRPTDWLQPDWNQNDSAAKDYVKNRTHYSVKAFEDIIWDGDMSGREICPVNGNENNVFVKVSDQIIPLEKLYGCSVVNKSGMTVEVPDNSIMEVSANVLYSSYGFVVVLSAPIEFNGVSFASAGTYFAVANKSPNTICLIAKETVNQLDAKYIPGTIARTDYVDQKTLTDTTFTVEGKAADAAVVGKKFAEQSKAIETLEGKIPSEVGGLTAAQISALDGMFKIASYTTDPTTAYSAFKVAFGIDDGGEGEPEEPENPDVTLTSIAVKYSGGDVDVGTALSDLTGIVVTATYSDGSTKTVSGYTLSGEIAEGVNIITVSYGGLTATFTVTGVAETVTYTVTNNLTNVTNSNAQTEVTEGFYSATLTVEGGYMLESVVITMGGVDVTADVYTAETGSILITEVTGDIVITATAAELKEIPLETRESQYVDIFAEDGTTKLKTTYVDLNTSYNATETDANVVVEFSRTDDGNKTYDVYIGNNGSVFAATQKSVSLSAGGAVRFTYTVKAGCHLRVATPNKDSTITVKAYGELDVYQPTAEYPVTQKQSDTVKIYSDGTTDTVLKQAYYQKGVYTDEIFAEDTDLIISLANTGEDDIVLSVTDAYLGSADPSSAGTVYYGQKCFGSNTHLFVGQVKTFTYTVKAGYAFVIINTGIPANMVYVEKA
ncbi:MAG: bacterial Ig-like domain-containing protein [Oscillospiraceae bacterium]|nr:bacterial Ig-like domain-containing protein [Oscillospiraceae bacterium]